MTLPEGLKNAEADIEADNLKLPRLNRPREECAVAALLVYDDALFAIHEEREFNDAVHARGVRITDGMDTLLDLMTAAGGFSIRKPPSTPSHDLADLAIEAFERCVTYAPFRYIVRLAHQGHISPTVVGQTLNSNLPVSAAQYLAYSILTQQRPAVVNWDPLRKLFSGKVKSSPTSYSVATDPKAYFAVLRHSFNQLASLKQVPDDWTLINYDFGQFRAVAAVLHGKALMHYFSRSTLARNGRTYPFNACNLAVYEPAALESDISKDSGVPEEVVKAILTNLTFGHLTTTPDISLQPLLRVATGEYLFCPSEMIINRFERNHCALVNRLPEKKIYQTISGKKENEMRDRILRRLPSRLRTWNGSLPGLTPNIDLAIIDDEERSVLVCELKWFILPSSPREEEDRDKDIAKGISQAVQIRDYMIRWTSDTRISLGIDSPSKMAVAVVAPSAGRAYVERHKIPTIVEEQLLKVISTASGLDSTIDWLAAENHLPKEGVDYHRIKVIDRISGWSLERDNYRLNSARFDFLTHHIP